MSKLLFIDFETYSAVDIKEAGGMAYASDDSTQIICLAWAFDEEEPSLWTVSSGPLPERVVKHVKEGGKVVAFNATFDWRIWNKVGARDFNWPSISLSQVADAQALCAGYQLPQNLADAGAALEIPMPKDAAGKAYVKACCIPNKNGEQPFPTGSTTASFQGLFRYCLRDVVAMQQIVYKLPRQELIPQEQKIWELTVEMNSAGLPVDLSSVIAIYEYLQKYIAKTVVELPLLTGGAVTTPGQIARIIAWCASQSFIIPNLQAETVELAIAKTNTPERVRRILELRQELGRSSTAKYKKIAEQAVVDLSGQAYVYDNVRYHGAGPGRWTGQGFQMHNLPRLGVKDICKERKLRQKDLIDVIPEPPNYEDPETWTEMFKAGVLIADPVRVAKALIRPMICAPKGYVIAVADYSSIENRLLAKAADDYQTLEDFNNGLDQYITMASARFGVPYSEVTDEQRRVGKVIILGCGYGMGGRKFRTTAALQAGLDLSEEEAKASVNAYRDRYPLVKSLWAHLRNAAAETVISGSKRRYKNTTFGVFSRNGIKWLAMQLPTGKSLYYMNPTIKDEFIPDYEYMGSVPTITHSGINPYTKKWSRLKLIPGRITENLIQGTAREVMANGMLNVKARMLQMKLIGSVHDEALALVREEDATDETMSDFIHNLCDVDFVPGCPIKAVGFYTKRYKKG